MADNITIHCAYTDLVDIASVIPNPRNPNHHSDKQVALLAKVIKVQGWRAPITVSNRSGFIVRGHGRLMAAQLLGLDTVPIDRQDYESEAAEYADLIADNRIAELSDIDNTLLGELLADTGDFAEFTGYSDDDITSLLNQVMADEVHEDDFDAEEAIKSIKEPMTKFGDVWMLGEHMLLCGDSTKTESLNCLLGGDVVDMVFTDPPYNVAYEGGTKEALTIQNDNMSDAEFDIFLDDVFALVNKALKPGGAFYICHSDSCGGQFRRAIRDNDLLIKQCLIWVKNTFVMGRQDYQWKHEPILYGWKPGASHKFYGGRKQSTVIDDNFPLEIEKDGNDYILHFSNETDHIVVRVPGYEIEVNNGTECDSIWRFNKPLRNGEHPTMKPIALCAQGIKNSSKPGELVFEPFGGSGSTLIACEQTKRRCRCIELDTKYCDVIVKRYIEFIGSNKNVYVIRNGQRLEFSEVAQ